jgi:plastocyanin
MSQFTLRSTSGISLVVFIVAVAVSLAYYQYFYLPEVNKRPIVPPDVLDPSESITVSIVEGSYIETQERNYVPKEVRGMLGVDNRILWVNDDITFHSVTSDVGYVDPVNGKFDSLDTVGLFGPDETYEFVFTQTGEYPYHCEPHPWMTGKITIVESFA